MAFNLLLRRASSSLLPLAIRSVGSPRTFRSTISAVLTAEKASFTRSSVVPFQRFSTKNQKDESLIEVLDSEIESAEQPDEKDIPDGFPFKIQDNPGERTVLLTREYEDENIKVEVDMPHVGDEEDEENDDNDVTGNQFSIPLVVTITKPSGVSLEFGVSAAPDEIQIESLSVRKPEGSEDLLAYEGPDFDDLDENLQKAFHKYLEIRGIKPSTTNFLHEYMVNKDSKEYLQWLNNLKKFIQK